MTPGLIFYLAIFTLGSALALAAWSYRRTQKAQERGETSSLAEIDRDRGDA